MTSYKYIYVVLLFILLLSNAKLIISESSEETSEECRHALIRPNGFFKRLMDFSFVKKFFHHWNPFTKDNRVKMKFVLYKRDFAICGREIFTNDDDSLEMSGFDAQHPTRIIIHGWMSKPNGSLNREVKNAYLSLTNINNNEAVIDDEDQEMSKPSATDYNVIVVDWSVISSNVNYVEVVNLIDDLGFLLAELLRYLNIKMSLNLDDVYLIGHSLGAQIAGSVGRQVQPDMMINTIFALDPAGPLYRNVSRDKRIDSTDARYVESINTSNSLGLQKPVGHATFYPNFGHSQDNCFLFGCSHSRAHRYFAESITSNVGFWGVRCNRTDKDNFILTDINTEYRMGGEPSISKNGVFFVQTRSKSPYAMGRRSNY